mmetsp:Transcript_106002/g.236475  ORF Transcript_106002/g.236475 Transcript_106002/m.236475 type:complete len:308 (-) Transcript_106002:911-1834(-)
MVDEVGVQNGFDAYLARLLPVVTAGEAEYIGALFAADCEQSRAMHVFQRRFVIVSHCQLMLSLAQKNVCHSKMASVMAQGSDKQRIVVDHDQPLFTIGRIAKEVDGLKYVACMSEAMVRHIHIFVLDGINEAPEGVSVCILAHATLTIEGLPHRTDQGLFAHLESVDAPRGCRLSRGLVIHKLCATSRRIHRPWGLDHFDLQHIHHNALGCFIQSCESFGGDGVLTKGKVICTHQLSKDGFKHCKLRCTTIVALVLDINTTPSGNVLEHSSCLLAHLLKHTLERSDKHSLCCSINVKGHDQHNRNSK